MLSFLPIDVVSTTSFASVIERYWVPGSVVWGVDFLAGNPNFLPGVTDFFINVDSAITYVEINKSTKFYKCGPGPDGYDTTADVYMEGLPYEHAGSGMWKHDQQDDRYNTFMFEISDGTVVAIREQCLP